MKTIIKKTTAAHQALAHPARLRVLAMLRSGELCACQITSVLGIAPSTASAHLAALRRADLVEERKEGRWVFYRLAEANWVKGFLESTWQLLKRDPQILEDKKIVRQLRLIGPEKLCRVDLNLKRAGVSMPCKPEKVAGKKEKA